ncbi:helix-turn-helix domain-containing protein [Streptomyces sp. MNU76]|uniref:helix-turn-helix domain-containing protein n=1 Tax=Streptomyces sp. MNU76 TaxID=2560026 RepID=UPI0035A93642
MGRRENPIGARNQSLALLASRLRSWRQEAGLTYAQLAERTPYSAATLSRAASGRTVPAREVVVAFAGACGGEPRHAEYLWRWARVDRFEVAGKRRRSRRVHVTLIRDFAELHAGMVELYQLDGSCSYRELESRAVAVGERLPRTTIGRFLTRATVPSRDFVLAFVRACGVDDHELEAWGQAWDRARRQRRKRP